MFEGRWDRFVTLLTYLFYFMAAIVIAAFVFWIASLLIRGLRAHLRRWWPFYFFSAIISLAGFAAAFAEMKAAAAAIVALGIFPAVMVLLLRWEGFNRFWQKRLAAENSESSESSEAKEESA